VTEGTKKERSDKWLIVGLGNPGAKYEHTRHNVGFMALDSLSSSLGIPMSTHSKSKSMLGQGRLGTDTILLLKPQTYMNLSGQAVSQVAHYYHVPVHQVVVIFDDVAIPLGKLRIRPGGSAGGQNGMKSIIQCFSGNQEFPRIRIGIGSPLEIPLDQYVLTAFSKKEKEVVSQIVEKMNSVVQKILTDGVLEAMNQFNGLQISEASS
jgi:peptidyl-tRNA hydrolase, PTH1 family